MRARARVRVRGREGCWREGCWPEGLERVGAQPCEELRLPPAWLGVAQVRLAGLTLAVQLNVEVGRRGEDEID